MTSSIKDLIRNIAPNSIVQGYHNIRRSIKQKQNLQKTTAEVFSEIYASAEWGNGNDTFDSGSGSVDSFTQPYCDVIQAHLTQLGHTNITLVDLGCGDFRVGQRLLDQTQIQNYIGIDIVPALIQHHQTTHATPTRQFHCLNIIEDPLPPGDICCIRQVLQHLSNDQIVKILSKLSQYQTIFITEHYPTDNPNIIPNLDKPHGGDIRLFDNSGVYLNQPPFEILNSSIELVLEIPGHSFGGNTDPGIIRTYKISFLAAD
jgi:hypothetical protein